MQTTEIGPEARKRQETGQDNNAGRYEDGWSITGHTARVDPIGRRGH